MSLLGVTETTGFSDSGQAFGESHSQKHLLKFEIITESKNEQILPAIVAVAPLAIENIVLARVARADIHAGYVIGATVPAISWQSSTLTVLGGD